ncbi:hypothetical protein ACS0TY_008287 [Phlomoides rotata]
MADEITTRWEGDRVKGGSQIMGMGWKPPPLGQLKLNSDVGVFSDGSIGLGFIVRNGEGQPVLAGATRYKATKGNSTLIEALALRFGFEAASTHGLRIHILESDSKTLIGCLTGNLNGDAAMSLIVGDILAKADGLAVGEF